MTRRRKDVPCSLCQEPTRDDGMVCSKCRRVFAAGKDFVRMTEARNAKTKGGPFEFRVSTWPLLSWYTDPRDWKDAGRNVQYSERHRAMSPSDASQEIAKAIFAIIEAVGGVRQERTLRYDQPTETAIPRGTEPRGQTAFLAPVQLADQIMGLFDAIQLHGRACYWEGRMHGENFLSRVAAGELSLEEINKDIAETEQRRRLA